MDERQGRETYVAVWSGEQNPVVDEQSLVRIHRKLFLPDPKSMMSC